MRSKKLAGAVSALLLAALASGCGGGGGGSGSGVASTTVSGAIFDGPVTEATVTITDSSGKVVGTAKSGADAKYSIPVAVGVSYPLLVSVSGGIDQVTGEAPVDMESLLLDANQTTANVAPVTSIIYQAAVAKAGSLGKVTSTIVSAVKSEIVSKFGFGLDAEESNFDPITSAVGAGTIASFMKSAQALAETVRRAVSPDQATMTLAFRVIGEDMADGVLDGKNGGAALSREMPAGFDAATIVSTITLQKALVGMEVINNSLKVTRSGGAQLSADEVKGRFSQSIASVEPTVTTAAALGKMAAVTVSDKQKSQVTTDIDNTLKLQVALDPGASTAVFASMAGAAKSLEVGKAGAGKVDSSVLVSAESSINAVTSGIKNKTYSASAVGSAFSAMVSPAGTSASTSNPSGGTSTPSANTGTTKTGLSGTVANGVAVPNAKVTVKSAKGDTSDVGTTDASGQYSGVAIPDAFGFPVIMSVTLPNGKDVLRSIIPSQKGATATANINPITQAITTQVLPNESALATLDVSDGEGGFAKKANVVVQTAFGDAVDYATFADKPFSARTADNPKAGGLADTLIDTIAGMDATRKPEEILASAANAKETGVSKNLMASPAFQARLAGELISQGRQAGDVRTLIQNESTSGANTAVLLANTETFAKSFQEVFTSADSELTGSDAQKKSSLESIVHSAAVAVAKIIDKKSVSGGDSLTNIVTNSMSLVKGPLIAIGKTNQGGANLALIIEATCDQMADLINTSTVNLTVSGANVATLGTQVKNFGEIVSSAVAQSLNTGKDKSSLNDKEKILVAANMGKGVASSLTAYMSDLAVDKSAMTDAQKASLNKAENTAKNVATALDSALVGMAADKKGDSLGAEVLNSMAQALVGQASETFKNYDLTVDASTFSGAASKVLTNMATLVVNNAAMFATNASSLDTHKQAALTGAMAGQLFDEVKNLDLTGDTPPDTALNVATNMANTMGTVLVTKVGQSSSYEGDSLQVLAASVIANATTELKKTTSLAVAIDSAALETLQQNAAQSAETSKTNMEASFKKFEDQGISLANITAGLAESGLAGAAMDLVLSQIQGTIVSGGDNMKGAAGNIAETAASMANAVLEKGGSLVQVQSAIAAPMVAMAEVAKGQSGQSSAQILDAIQNSANTLEQAAQVLATSKTISLEEMIVTAGNVSSVVSTQLSDNTSNLLLNNISSNIAQGKEMKLDTLAGQLAQEDPAILSKATAQQAVIQDQAVVILKAANKLPEFIPFTENPTVIADAVWDQAVWDTAKWASGSLDGKAGQAITGFLPVNNPDNEKLTYKIVTPPTKGVVTITDPATGSFSYQPSPGMTGADGFSFVVNDGISDSASIMVPIQVVNKLPEFQSPPAPVVAQVGQPLSGLLPIKNDQTGKTLVFKIVAQGTKGTVAITDPATGSYTYQPNPGTIGQDTFSFSVFDGVGETPQIPMTIQVTNKLPEFQPPTNAMTAELGKPFVGMLPIKNDQTGETLFFKVIIQGTKGAVTVTDSATGAFTYKPNPGTVGEDTFAFTVNDGAGETGAIVVTMHIVNPPPIPLVDAVWDQGVWDTAKWASGSLDGKAGQAITGFLPVNNPDGEKLTYKIVTPQPTKGVVTITDPVTGGFTYQPNPGAAGPDSFSFIVNDGISDSTPIMVPVQVMNKLPEFVPPPNSFNVLPGIIFNGLLPIKDDQAGKTLTFKIVDNAKKGIATIVNPSTGAFSYQANPATNGSDSFTFTIDDGYGVTAPMTVAMQITNNPPVPVVDAMWDQGVWDAAKWTSGSLEVIPGKILAGSLSVNNPDGDPLTYQIVTQATKGLVTITDAATGAFTYAPNAGAYTANTAAYGTDSFTFKVNDGVSDSTSINVAVNINAAPVVQAGADATGFAKGTFSLNGNVADQNGSGDILSHEWTQVGGPPVTINNASTAAAVFTLPVVTMATDLLFKFTAIDKGGASSSGTVKVTVYPEDSAANRKISVNNVSQAEGDTATTNAAFAISMDYPSTRSISVQYNTGDDTATVGADYAFANGTVTFAPGETGKVVSVPVIGETLDEGNEKFNLLLHTVSGAVIDKAAGVCTITDDDVGKGAVWDHAVWDANSWL